MECRGDGARLEPVVVRFTRKRGIDRLDGADRLREQLHARGALDEHREHGRLLDRRRRYQLAMVSEQDGALVAERLVNDLPFLVADRWARPFGEKGAVVRE